MNTNNFEDDDLPFSIPSEWYPYYFRACKCRMWVEDIIVDAFSPDGPGRCPIICCPECGKDFVMNITRDTVMSETDPNRTGKLFQPQNNKFLYY